MSIAGECNVRFYGVSMSDLALSETGEQKTASEFHDDYILSGVKHERFICPFCYVGLVAKAIYIDGPQGKSPHFSCFPKKPHINGCDGYPLVDGKTTKETKRTNKIRIGKEEFVFPEKLVPRSVTSKEKFIDNMKAILDSNEGKNVEKRRWIAGKEVGRARYTSSIIRSFASSKKKIISLAYQYAKEENLSDDERSELIRSALTQAPIELEGYKTNYKTAFQGTMYLSKYKKIWDGKGKVKISDSIIYIISNQPTLHEIDEVNLKLDFYVKIRTPDNLDSLSRYHRSLVDRLLLARTKESTVRWFAYGMALLEKEKNAVLLTIDNLDYFFVEKI